MNSTPAASTAPTGPPLSAGEQAPRLRRVRHQARETAALMAFSATCSCALALIALLLMSLGR